MHSALRMKFFSPHFLCFRSISSCCFVLFFNFGLKCIHPRFFNNSLDCGEMCYILCHTTLRFSSIILAATRWNGTKWNECISFYHYFAEQPRHCVQCAVCIIFLRFCQRLPSNFRCFSFFFFFYFFFSFLKGCICISVKNRRLKVVVVKIINQRRLNYNDITMSKIKKKLANNDNNRTMSCTCRAKNNRQIQIQNTKVRREHQLEYTSNVNAFL